MRIVANLVGVLSLVSAAAAQESIAAPSSLVRPIGPAAPGGRIVDVDVHPDRPWTLLAASASGGLWRSVNNGTTWSCVFDQALSLGDVAIAPSDPDIVWLATGEGNNQRSSYAGNGVWLSRDGGVKFEHVGLEESHHIGRIAVDPTNPEVAYVAALGHLYTPNEQRGLFKTSDGGKNWECVLHLGPEIGVADVVVDPVHPALVYAASYERRRRAWNFADAGRSAIYKSQNGGETWTKLTGGLPTGKLGRIGLALFPSDPDRLYACIDNENPKAVADAGKIEKGEKSEPKKAAEPEAIGGEVWRTLDGGRSWEKRNDKPVRGEPPYYYGQIRVDPHDPEHVWVLGIQVFVSKDGGKSFSDGERASSLHSDHHALWFDPVRRGRLLLGNDGGLAQSYDDGGSFDYYSNLAVAQLYTVSVDLAQPYRVYGGLQDNGVWMGPSRTRNPFGAGANDWRFIGGGDGMYVLSDPADPDTVYLESQFGALSRTNVRTQESAWIQPPSPEGAPRDRYNWCAPILLSQHNSRVVYFGAQKLWKSLDRGDHWRALGGDLTTNDPEKVKGNVPHCTITTISESPLDPDLLLVGGDDGSVQWSSDGGHAWISLAGRFPGLPDHRWTSRVELSRHDAKNAWITFSGFRDDDFTPYVYRTRDSGRSFELVTASLPAGPVNVVHESPRRPDVLFLGSDAGAFFSSDGGGRWQPLASGEPTVSVLDFAIHPRERELVLATHGRGFEIVDVTAIEQLDAKVVAAPAHLFEPSDAIQWQTRWGSGGGWSGDRVWRAKNPDAGAPIWYWLGDGAGNDAGNDATKPAAKPAPKPVIEILDEQGNVVRRIEGEAGRGLHRVVWDYRPDPAKEKKPEAAGDQKKDAPKRRPHRYQPGDEDESEREREAEERGESESDEAGAADDPQHEFEEWFESFERGVSPDAMPEDEKKGRGRRADGPFGPGVYRVRLEWREPAREGLALERELHVLADPGS